MDLGSVLEPELERKWRYVSHVFLLHAHLKFTVEQR